MTPITITLTEEPNQTRAGEPLTFGVPLPKGAAHGAELFQLTQTSNPEPWPMQAEATAYWPDGSIRWLLVRTQLPGSPQLANAQLVLQLQAEAEVLPSSAPSGPQAEESTTEWRIRAGGFEHRINKTTGTVHSRETNNSAEWCLSAQLTPAEANEIEPTLDQCEIENVGSVSLQVRLSGHWPLPEKPRFTLSMTFYAHGGLVELDYCLHNPNRASHPGGLWDLGDPGSFYFKALSLNVSGERPLQGRLQAEPGEPATAGPAALYQDSSGGENWHSQNHVDKNGEVTTRFRGYRLNSESGEYSGLRAQPSVQAIQGDAQVALASPRFWQNFPASLAVNEQNAAFGLFPGESGQVYELQGGERKTHRLYLAFGQPLEALHWVAKPTLPKVDAHAYEEAQAFPWFKAGAEPGPLEDLIRIGLEGESNFFAKREIIDEYGWRNFGDIFADHETLYQSEVETPLVSHYNNQYDAIYGFARQFAQTGDPRWFELMDDLARHVTDIDIYHTDEDRAEYNNGLFWHTDHYLPAHTATHRTFTRYNTTSSTPGQTGGGPAEEHCYTTGLMVHHYMTGNEASRQAVVHLTNWMITLHEGSKGLLNRLWSIKKRELIRLKKHLKGQNPSPFDYPFTRGTGNYLTALVDAFEVSGNPEYLYNAEAVIRGTLHPKDDLTRRNLLNVELAWSYLVLLASLARYLAVKNRLGQFDAAFFYARASFLHYTQWMRQHEQPFLTDPQQLEFPNDTWVAQDVRKALLMFQAADLNPSEAEAYRRKGEQWLREVTEQLAKSQTRHFARILIILMQNQGPQVAREVFDVQGFQQNNSDFGEAPKLSILSLLTSLAMKSLKGVLEFRPSREKAWLSTRLNR